MRFAAAYEQSRDAIYGYLVYMTRDVPLAEDLSQEVFLRMFLHLDKFREEAGVRTWALRIVAPVNLVRDIKGELPLGIYYDGGLRYGLYQINYEMQYVVTEEDRIYHISKEFAQLVEDFAETGILPPGEIMEVTE